MPDLKGAEVIELLRASNQKLQDIFCLAIKLGHADLVSALIMDGSDVNAPDSKGLTPISYACLHGRSDILLLLLEHRAQVNTCDHYIFAHLPILTILIQKQIILPKDYPRILFDATRMGRHDIVAGMMKAGVSPNIRDINGETPLIHACRLGFTEVVSTLLSAGADIHDALPTAVRANRIAVVELLLPHYLLQDVCNATVLAAHHHYVDLVLRLTEAGGNPNSVSDEGNSLLLWAAEHQQDDELKVLLYAGADPNLANSHHFTPLMFAAWHGNQESLDALIDAGAKLNTRNKYGSTALMWAVENRQYESVRTLIIAGADPSLRNHAGQSALEWAVKMRDMRMIQLLRRGQVRQLCLMLLSCSPEDVSGILIRQKSLGISKEMIVDYLIEFETDPARKMPLLQKAIATDSDGRPSNGLSRYIRTSQGIGFRRIFCGEATVSVSRIKSELAKISQEKLKSAVDMPPKFR